MLSWKVYSHRSPLSHTDRFLYPHEYTSSTSWKVSYPKEDDLVFVIESDACLPKHHNKVLGDSEVGHTSAVCGTIKGQSILKHSMHSINGQFNEVFPIAQSFSDFKVKIVTTLCQRRHGDI